MNQDSQIVQKANEVSNKHRALLSAFGKCHHDYSAAKVFTDPEIAIIGELH